MSADVAAFADEVEIALGRVSGLVVWTRSLRDVRERKRLTKIKREQFSALAESLAALEESLASLLEPPDDAVREAARLEFERFQLLRRQR